MNRGIFIKQALDVASETSLHDSVFNFSGHFFGNWKFFFLVISMLFVEISEQIKSKFESVMWLNLRLGLENGSKGLNKNNLDIFIRSENKPLKNRNYYRKLVSDKNAFKALFDINFDI